MDLFTVSCPTCGKIFSSDIEQRAKNDLEMHLQDNISCRQIARTDGPEISLGPRHH